MLGRDSRVQSRASGTSREPVRRLDDNRNDNKTLRSVFFNYKNKLPKFRLKCLLTFFQNTNPL